MIIHPTTDLAQFTNAPVVINGVRTALVQTIHHGAESVHCRDALDGGVWGDCVEEAHSGLRGGSTAFWWPYGTDLTLEGEK